MRPLKRPHSFHDQDHQNVAAESRIGKKSEPANGERVISAALCACLRKPADGWLIVHRPSPHDTAFHPCHGENRPARAGAPRQAGRHDTTEAPAGPAATSTGPSPSSDSPHDLETAVRVRLIASVDNQRIPVNRMEITRRATHRRVRGKTAEPEAPIEQDRSAQPGLGQDQRIS